MQPTPARYLILAVVADGGVPDEAHQAVQAAMSAAGLPDWSSVEAGNGLVLLVPEPPHAYVGTGQFVNALASRLSTRFRWRLRVGAQLAGIDPAVPVLENHAVRVTLLLADARPVRRALDDAGRTLAVALSSEVVRTRPGGVGSSRPDPLALRGSFELPGPFELPGEPIVGWVAVLASPSGIGLPSSGEVMQGSGGPMRPADPDQRPPWLIEEAEIEWEATGPADYAPPPGPDFPTDR